MKKNLLLALPLLLVASLLLVQCVKNAKATVAKRNPQLTTHQEAIKALHTDSLTALKPADEFTMTAAEQKAFFEKNDLSQLFKTDWPQNGFFGDDRYRIEFMFTEVKKDATNPNIYIVKGKNRHKKVITAFEGTYTFTEVKKFDDKYISMELVPEEEMDVESGKEVKQEPKFALKGNFILNEDPKLINTSGVFRGTMTADVHEIDNEEQKTKEMQLWFFSKDKNTGYRCDGTWAAYKNPTKTKPVIYAADIYTFGNDILKDFSMGERDVQINEKYRNLGWDDFYDGEEWWNESPAQKTR